MKTSKLSTRDWVRMGRHPALAPKGLSRLRRSAFPDDQSILRSTFRYKIIQKLGEGGSGRTFLAHEYDSLDTFRAVALKMLHTPEDEALQETFILEARLMRLMSHHNIVPVFGFERGTTRFQKLLSSLGIREKCEAFMIMEYIPGFNLYDFVRLHQQKQIRVYPLVAAYIASRIARGVAYAHDFRHPGISAYGVIHRDITPSNVLIREDGPIKITDFGIAYPFDPGHRKPTLNGTLHYIAPELLAGEKPAATSDVYSIGLLLEWMLTGHPRYVVPDLVTSATDVRMQLERIARFQFDPKILSGVPSRLVEICRNASTALPAMRYQAASDLALDLELFLRDSDCVLSPALMELYLDCVQSALPGAYRKREFVMISGKETIDFKPYV